MAETTKAAPKKAPKPNSLSESEDVIQATRAIRRNDPLADVLNNEREKWLERHHGVVMASTHTIGHPVVYKNYNRYFEKMSQYLFFIPVLGRALLSAKNEKDVTAVERAVRSTIERAIAHLETLSKSGRAVQAAKGIEDPIWNKSYVVEVKFTSPMDKLLFKFFTMADEFLLINGALWIEGALSDDSEQNERIRGDNELDVKNTIKSVIYGIIVNHKRIMNSIRREQQANTQRAKVSATKESATAGHEISSLVETQRATEAEKIPAAA